MSAYHQEIAKILGLSPLTVNRILRENKKLKFRNLRNLAKDPQAWKRRDEFYSWFKDEDTADHMWERFMDNYWLEHNTIILDSEMKYEC